MKRPIAFLVAALSAACSASPTPADHDSPSTATSPSAPASEDARVEAFLNARYMASDVRTSFRTELGEDVDCIDFFAQPAVKERAARGRPLTVIPEPPPLPPHAEGAPRRGADEATGPRCPAGTVAQRHLTRADVAAVGLDKLLQKSTPPMPPNEIPGYAHVTADFDGVGGINTGYDTFSINSPSLGSNGSHSLSQSWMLSGTDRLGGCYAGDPNCEQSVEVGWWVLSGTTPTLFTWATNSGYNGPPLSFTAVSPDYHVGQSLPASVPGGAQHEMSTIILASGGAWWIAVRIDGGYLEYLGYYEGFLPSMQTTAQVFQVGGEVANRDGSTNFSGIQMGSGDSSIFGYPYAAYHRNYAVYVPDTSDFLTATSYFRETAPSSYWYSTGLAPGDSTWTNSFYFGPAFVWWPL
jgi:hypothetical protein